MPHKRAKRTEREKQRVQSGSDLAPAAKQAIDNEEIPKGAARVLNAAKIQREYAENKRKTVDNDDNTRVARKKRRKDGSGADDGDGGADVQLRIMPGESMAHFNRRVEDSMRHTVREAMQESSARVRQARKEELAAKGAKGKPSSVAQFQTRPRREHATVIDSDAEDDTKGARRGGKDDGRLKEFEKISTSAPRRLNDVVQAPPVLKNLPRKAKMFAAQGNQKSVGAQSLREGVLSMAQKASMEEERERVIRLYRKMKRGKGL